MEKRQSGWHRSIARYWTMALWPTGTSMITCPFPVVDVLQVMQWLATALGRRNRSGTSSRSGRIVGAIRTSLDV
jgi:hypothetical protein